MTARALVTAIVLLALPAALAAAAVPSSSPLHFNSTVEFIKVCDGAGAIQLKCGFIVGSVQSNTPYNRCADLTYSKDAAVARKKCAAFILTLVDGLKWHPQLAQIPA